MGEKQISGHEQHMDDLSIDKKKAEKRADKMKEQEGEPKDPQKSDRNANEKER